jgi:hypothetical protein
MNSIYSNSAFVIHTTTQKEERMIALRRVATRSCCGIVRSNIGPIYPFRHSDLTFQIRKHSQTNKRIDQQRQLYRFYSTNTNNNNNEVRSIISNYEMYSSMIIIDDI